MESNTSWINSYKDMWKKACSIQGRTRRAVYIKATILQNTIIIATAMIITSVCTPSDIVGFMFLGFRIIFTLPLITLSVRRIHDIGYSGWTIAFAYAAIVLLLFYDSSVSSGINMILFFILACMNSQMTINKYGICPKIFQ